jgi:hypothetical protein
MAVQVNTHKVIIYIVVIYFIEAAMFGSTMWQMVQPSTSPSLWQQMGSIISFIGSLLTFNVPELPALLRWLFTVPILSGLVLSIANLIRG